MKTRQSVLFSAGIAIITVIVFVIIFSDNPVQTPRPKITERQLPKIENTQQASDKPGDSSKPQQTNSPKEQANIRKPSPEIAAMEKTIDDANTQAATADQHIAELKQRLSDLATSTSSQPQQSPSIEAKKNPSQQTPQAQITELKQRLQKLQTR